MQNGTFPSAAPKSVVDTTNTGDTAWILTSTAFVLLMTAPGLALFYGGLVNRKNVVNMMAMSIFTAVRTLIQPEKYLGRQPVAADACRLAFLCIKALGAHFVAKQGTGTRLAPNIQNLAALFPVVSDIQIPRVTFDSERHPTDFHFAAFWSAAGRARMGAPQKIS